MRPMKRRSRPPTAPLAALMVVALPCGAWAQTLSTPPTSHPIYVSAEGAAHDDAARDAFRQAATKLGLGPAETVDPPPLPKPQGPASVAAGSAQVRELAFEEGRSLLASAVAEATSSGAAGFNRDTLCDAFLYLAMALDRADWRDLPEAGPQPANADAAAAYLQAAVLCPQRQLYQRTFPPLARHRFDQAVTALKTRGSGLLVIDAPDDALVSVDAGPLAPAPVKVSLPYGEHFVRVERPGRMPWGARVPLSLPVLDVNPATQAFRSFSDAEAVKHARRMAAAYALVGELLPGSEPLVQLRLVEVATGKRIDSTRVPLQREVGGVYAAAMRLDEQARRLEMKAGAPQDAQALQIASAPVRATDPSQPGPTEDPEGWARKRWPLLAAVGVVVLTSLVLGVVVALDDKSAVQ